MPINKATAVQPFATLTGTTNAGTWTLVTCPSWARWAEVINNTGAEVAVRYPATTEADTYATSDDQVPCFNSGSQVVEFSEGRAKSDKATTFSVRTASAQTLHFSVGG